MDLVPDGSEPCSGAGLGAPLWARSDSHTGCVLVWAASRSAVCQLGLPSGVATPGVSGAAVCRSPLVDIGPGCCWSGTAAQAPRPAAGRRDRFTARPGPSPPPTGVPLKMQRRVGAALSPGSADEKR